MWASKLEATPYGRFNKMMASEKTEDPNFNSSVPFDHYAVPRGAAVTNREFPKGKRTFRAVIADGELHIQAGAGIVADSVPSQEWQETMNKGRAIFRAVAMAVAGLDPAALED